MFFNEGKGKAECSWRFAPSYIQPSPFEPPQSCHSDAAFTAEESHYVVI